ncbi:hypothetical protein HOL21_02365 [Candidatus Woesearchaeota archaeon]|jgi:hypothetical protein|nr:hypothetical protein [Candidatus Woesearchaeota archaeon]MBT5397035.1 hypothetical protein [Candidatus Woesearchaeota archaeon]MBT5924645.1 hypothetical protein [Candidatus Woesearchaeota archaeon]MBT6367419.1 hypothetical protein [Candidatus Woesearchaeota archaeon]
MVVTNIGIRTSTIRREQTKPPIVTNTFDSDRKKRLVEIVRATPETAELVQQEPTVIYDCNYDFFENAFLRFVLHLQTSGFEWNHERGKTYMDHQSMDLLDHLDHNPKCWMPEVHTCEVYGEQYNVRLVTGRVKGISSLLEKEWRKSTNDEPNDISHPFVEDVYAMTFVTDTETSAKKLSEYIKSLPMVKGISDEEDLYHRTKRKGVDKHDAVHYTIRVPIDIQMSPESIISASEGYNIEIHVTDIDNYERDRFRNPGSDRIHRKYKIDTINESVHEARNRTPIIVCNKHDLNKKVRHYKVDLTNGAFERSIGPLIGHVLEVNG